MVGFQQVTRKSRTVNPQGQKRRKSSGGKAKHRAPRKQNPDLFTLGALVNPTYKGAGNMAAQKRKGKPKPQKTATKHRTGNPQKGKGQKHRARTKNGSNKPRRRGRAKNPNITAQTMMLLKNGALALFGLVMTRQIPQLALQGKNQSWLGYGSNLVVALVSAAIAGAVSKGAGIPVAIGGGLYLVDRVLTEQFSAAGQILALSGCGDAKVATNGQRGLSGIRTGYFPLPVQYDANGNPIIPQAIIDAAQRGMMAAAPAGSGGMRGVRGPGYPNKASGNRLIAA